MGGMNKTRWAIFGIATALLIGAFIWQMPGENLPSPENNISTTTGSIISTPTSTSDNVPANNPPITTPTSSVPTATTTLPLASNKLSDEELRDRIGDLLLIGFRGLTVNLNISKPIKDLKIGGVILFDYDSPSKSYPRNITDSTQVKNLISNIQATSDKPLFIAVDAEGGLVNRLKPSYGFINIPSAESLGNKNDTAYTRQIAGQLGNQLRSLGFNLNFAPVVDVNVNPTNPIIGALDRSFSSDPYKVTAHAEAFIRGLHDNGIITAIKHFPGHGSSVGDTHKGIVDVTNTYKQIELIPFRELIKKGLPDMVMTAHVINRNVDPSLPATLSPFFIKNILRKELGWNGIVVTDDMQMGAITSIYGLGEAAVMAIKAGGDVLIISNNINVYDEQAPYKVRDAIFNAVRQRRISEDTIIDSSNRIRALKNKFKI